MRKEAECQRLCPECNTSLNYDEVDIGVGTQQGNFRCDRCGWNEADEASKLFKPQVRKCCHVTLRGCDESTEFVVSLTDTEAEVLRLLEQRSKEESEFLCMPVLEFRSEEKED